MAKKKKINILSNDQQKTLQELTSELLGIAANVVEEYKDLDLSELSELSSSITQINEDSPFLDEIFEGESWKRVIKNIVSSSYSDPPASFEKTTYVSKIGIYDENQNLIAIAKPATPVKKTAARDFTFKLKLDI